MLQNFAYLLAADLSLVSLSERKRERVGKYLIAGASIISVEVNYFNPSSPNNWSIHAISCPRLSNKQLELLANLDSTQAAAL